MLCRFYLSPKEIKVSYFKLCHIGMGSGCWYGCGYQFDTSFYNFGCEGVAIIYVYDDEKPNIKA